MTQNKPSIKILNTTDVVADTSAVANAMVAAGGGMVELKNLAGTFKKFDFRKRTSMKISRSLTETAKIQRAAFTAAALTEYSFSITQDVDIDGTGKRSNTEIITYKSVAASNTEIEAGLKASVDAFIAAGRLKLTAVVSGSGYITLTGAAGYPLFSASNITGITISNQQATVAGHATAGTAVAESSGLITLTSAATHAIVVGQVVSVATCAGFDATKDGVLYEDSIPPTRVVAVTGTTMVLDAGTVGTGTNTTASAAAVIEAVEDFGQGQDLLDASIVDSFDSASVFSASKKYTKVSILAYGPKGYGGFNQSSGDQLQQIDLYYDEAATAYDTSVGPGTLTLGRVEEVAKGYSFGATTADPLLS
jgi:hypothetical protein